MKKLVAIVLAAVSLSVTLPHSLANERLVERAAEADCLDPAKASLLEPASLRVSSAIVEREGEWALDIINRLPVSFEVLVASKTSDGEPERSMELPPLGAIEVDRVEAGDRESAARALRTKWRLRSYPGVAGRIEPDEDYSYRLPFKAGRTYRLVQGFDGKQSHGSAESRYALDFQLEVGEPVHAARGGIVVRAVDWFCRAGGRELVDQVNLIVILHDDGTMAQYVHLDHAGVLVEEGERVERGQHIGISGLTGFSGGPHLHFVVKRERDISVPIRFEGYETADLGERGPFRVPQ